MKNMIDELFDTTQPLSDSQKNWLKTIEHLPEVKEVFLNSPTEEDFLLSEHAKEILRRI